MTRSIRVMCLLLCLCATAAPRGASPGASSAPTAAPAKAPLEQPALPLPAQRVVEHVSRTIAWYRRIVALQQLPADPDDVVPRDRLYQGALTALQLAFDFGQAAAALDKSPPKPASAVQAPGAAGLKGAPAGARPADDDAQHSTAEDIDRAAVQIAARVAALRGQLSSLGEQIVHASKKDRQTLTAERGEVSAELDLVRQVQDTVGQIQRFAATSESPGSSGSSGLAAQIADLQRSVPEIHLKTALARGEPDAAGGGPSGPGSAAARSSATSASSPSGSSTSAGSGAAASATRSNNFRPESAGVVALAGQWFSIQSSRSQLADAMRQTDALLKEIDSVRKEVSQAARALARTSLESIPSTDPAQLAAARQQLEAAVTRFRQLSTLLVPVGEEGITVENARNILSEWRSSVTSRRATISRYLALRVGLLLGSIVVVLAISEIWRRATFRYLHDTRRRAQFLALRRVAVGVALTLVIVFGLVSEVGSVATYAGLITAGLAVALQNVILAVVAYFFLIGRYGVRVGDRITLAGVTGRVVDIGLVRIYLMELTGPELRSSGRMVVLSNAVLFQPTALFKQLPGGDYAWHTISMTLAANADVQNAEKRLSDAANAVYEHYRPAIERQHAALQRFIDFETAMPQPEVYVRFTGEGLECTVRYPVEPAHSASTDQKMLAAIRAAQAKAPELQLVSGPVLKSET